jgi:cytochrome c peroxidase
MRNFNKNAFLNRTFTLLFLSLLIYACKKEDDTTTTAQIKLDETPFMLDFGPFPPPMIPVDNELTVQKVQLGRMLFYEKKLSLDGSQACASCHRQADAFSDTAKFSLGVEGLRGKRQAMAVFNLAWHNNEFFWDGRAHLLRDQSLMPIQDALEMNETLDNVVQKLSSSKMYRDQFTRAFGSDEVSSEKMSLAMEQFMMTIVSFKSKYDNFRMGKGNLTDSEERGRKLFFTEYNPFFPDSSGADCAHCHGGPNFENNKYLNNGLDTDADISDIGREKVTGNARDKAAFKVPSLRNIALTPPYMHDGRFATLEEVVDHYDHGINFSSSIDPAIENTRDKGLMLSQQDKADLVAFLKTLTDYELTTNTAYADPFEK